MALDEDEVEQHDQRARAVSYAKTLLGKTSRRLAMISAWRYM